MERELMLLRQTTSRLRLRKQLPDAFHSSPYLHTSLPSLPGRHIIAGLTVNTSRVMGRFAKFVEGFPLSQPIQLGSRCCPASLVG